ncbi:hypothetical protein KR093_000907 [Drosophila rubida]|uniref:EB domain-containing protein n=1 Tax=Drosophila rubida TaxID=30044 RepID=A0AAD4K913_9MUSC|nr:hypothetical protein KR093_000907 [Drosophila rubida]
MLKIKLILFFGCSWLLNVALADDLLELSCSIDTDCQQYERATCRNSHCQCTAAVGDKREPCKPKDRKWSNIIGGPCTQDHLCPQLNTKCDATTEQCYCTAGYMPSVDKRRCLPQAVALNAQCELTQQCQAKDKWAVCHLSQKSCLCKEYFEPHDQRCLAVLDISCRNDTMCTATDSICLIQLDKCACIEGRVHNHNKTMCLSGAAYGESCTTSGQCQLMLGSGGLCRNNSCGCQPKYYAKINSEAEQGTKLTTCEPIVNFGANCRRNEDCEQPSDNLNMQCKWGECICRDTHHVVDNARCVLNKASTGQRVPHLLFPIFWLIYSRT